MLHDPAAEQKLLNWIAALLSALWTIVCTGQRQGYCAWKPTSEDMQNYTDYRLSHEPLYMVEPRTEDDSLRGGNQPLGRFDERARAGISQLHSCDHSVYCMLPLVRRILKAVDPAATAVWLHVRPRPKFRLHDADDHEIREPTHSIIRMTMGSGRQWVIDPSGPQFGIRSDCVYAWTSYDNKFIANEGFPNRPRWWKLTPKDDDKMGKDCEDGEWSQIRSTLEYAYWDWETRLKGEEDWWKTVMALSKGKRKCEFRDLVARMENAVEDLWV